ncbi:serine hydrolase [Dyella jiangningensis]|uniref:serine hydrolase domain-containing protein n=1 Tax=Dyella jiangningensis TaxID=1379159 RepID=UPI0024102B56|nr:serine hydrolase domain-containing protein [Dyella jiangningensis]MDG2539483.1 serine hydrolase [Dyella jiangningensis]
MKTIAPVVARGCQLLLATIFAVCSSLSHAQIQINPLPEPKAATITQLGAHELTAGDVQPWLDEQMAKAMSAGNIAGAVAVVVKDGNVVVSKGYGYADVATKKPVDPASTMFRVASISKLFTWTAVMQLVEQHKLELDADINRYLDIRIPPRDGKPVTLRDLMTHTAGFEDVLRDRYATDTASLMSNEAWVKRWVPARIYPAGEVPAYSTYGTALAGYIVQRVSGMPFDTYVERHIFTPLGMQHASFRQPLPNEMQADAVPGYRSADASPQPFALRTAAPAGALSISGEDMARFMIAHLQFGRAGEAQPLEQASVKAMHGYLRAAIPSLPGMALGFARMDRDGQVILGHGGDIPDFHSLVALFPEQHAGLFIAIDGNPDSQWLRRQVDDFDARYFPPLPQLKLPTLATAKQHAGQLAGRYTSSITSQSNVLALRDRFREVQVSVAADGTLHVPQLGAEAWREVKPYVWVDDGSGHQLAALVRDGKVRMWSTDTLSPTQVFLPATGWAPARLCAVLTSLLAILALVALSWPVAALLRRRGIGLVLPEGDERWYRLSRITPLFYLAFAGGWALMLPRLGAPHLEMRLLLLQIVGVLAVLGTIPAAIETWRAWRTPGAWWRRVSGVVLLMACLGAIAFIVNFHLLGPSYNY